MSDAKELTAAQRADLRTVAAMIVPESAEYKVPGADDPADRGRHAGNARPRHRAGGAGAGSSGKARRQTARPARRSQTRRGGAGVSHSRGGAAAATLVRVVLQCYYRDDRVLRSLGLELRAPFPKGHVLPDGDWSLLDPVRARGGTLRGAVALKLPGHACHTRPQAWEVTMERTDRRGGGCHFVREAAITAPHVANCCLRPRHCWSRPRVPARA